MRSKAHDEYESIGVLDGGVCLVGHVLAAATHSLKQHPTLGTMTLFDHIFSCSRPSTTKEHAFESS